MKKPGLSLLLLLSLQFAYATQHIIRFSNDSTCSYTFSDIKVNVGDTIIWAGDFSICPLSNMVIPNGAIAYRSGEDVVYMYVVETAGQYQYNGPDLASTNAAGDTYEDDANSSSLVGNATQLYVLQEQGLNVLYSDLPAATPRRNYTVSIYDVNGKKLVDTNIDLSTSRNVLPQLPAGIYLMHISENENILLSQQIWQP